MESRTAWNKWNHRMSCHTGNPYDQCTRKHCLHTDQYNVAAVIPEPENPPPLKDITQKVTCNQQVVVMDPSRQMKSRVNENTKQLRFNSCRGGTQDSGVWARHIRINQMKKQDIEPQRQRSSLVSVQRGLSQNKGQSSQDNTTSHLTHSINPNLMTEFTKKEQNKVDYYHCPWEQKEQLHGFTNNVSPWRCDISMNYVEFKENCPNYVIDNGQQETLGSSTNFYDGVKYRNHGPYGDCYDSQNTITTLIVPTTEIVLPLPLDTEYNQRPATLNTWNLELNENIHRDAGEWLVEPLLDAEHSSQGTDVERATDMARYQYDSTSSLHLSDLNRNQSYTAPSYHSAADVQDARHDNRYYGYQPSSVSSKEDLSELYYIPGQHKLMHLPARSRFSYAYGETAKHKYGYEDEYADTNSNHYDTSPRSQYSYIDTPRSQDTQDSYDSRYHETPRDSGFSYSRPPQEHVDESKSQYSRNGQNGYPLDRNGDCWSETASVDTKQDVNQVLLESAYYARKRRYSFGAVSPDWQRGSPDTSPSSRDQNQAYGALNAYTGFNGRSGRNGAVGDGRMSMSDTPNFRTAYSDHVAENRGSSTVPVTNGRYPGDGSHSRADTSSYPPQYMELTSGHTQQDSGYYTGYHKPEYNNLRDREPSQLESHSNASYPGYLYSGNYVNDYEGRSSPGLSHSGNSSSSKSKQSASTNDLTPREQTWTYSGAIYVDNNEMKSETPVAFGISSVPSVNQAQPVDSRSLPPSSTMPEGSRLSSYGVKVKPAGGSTTTMFDTSVGSHSSPSSSYTSQRSSNSVHSLQRSTSPEQRSVISGQRNTSPDQRSTSSVQKTSYTSRRCPSPSPTYPIQRSSSPAFTRPQGSKDAWRRHSYAEPSTVQEDFKTPLPSSFTSVSHKSHSLTQTSPVSARTTVQSLTQTSPSSATHSSSPHSRTTVRSSTQTTPPSATRSSSPHIQATIHSSSETSPPSATRGSSSLHRRSLSSPRVKFDTEEKENHYDNSYYADSGRLGDSYNSSRELSMNDLKTNQAEKPEIRRPSSPKMSLSSLGPSSRLKQSNTSLSVSSLNRSRSSSLDRMHDGKSSGFVKSRPISVKMSSSTEITPAMLQRFKKRISKPQIQSNVPVYTSTFLTRSGNHGNGDSHSRSTSQSGKGIQTSPGSTKTLNRMSSILWAMKLIELLHKTPSSSHDELVVQARWFRKWYTNVNRIKSLREEQNQMMEDAAVFWRRHLLRKCLSVWKNGSSPDKRNDAEHLHRRHMLTKGLQGLKYAICQKKQLEEKLAAQCQSNLLVRHFDTWKSTYHEHRHETLRHAFLTWQQFKLDTDKFKQLSCKHDKMKVSGAFRAWKDKHSDVQKEGLAGLHYKVTLFSKGFQSWRLYTSERRVKTTQNEMGKVYFEEKTFVKYFKNWQAEYDKFQIAKNHHSMTVLSKILTGWRRSLPIVRAERLQDMSEAKEFHKKALLKVYFAQWSLKLKQQIMQKMMNRNRLKQCFEVWYLKQQRQAIQRQIEESRARKTLKRRVLYAWMVNVRKQKEIRERFISVLHRIHVRQALCDWRQFTLFKKQLRKKMTSFKEMRNKRLLKKCCHYWMGRYNIRLQQIQSRQVWSDRCTMAAYKAWTEMVRRRRLEAKLRMTQPHRDSNLLQSAFRTWLAAKQQSDWDTQRAKSVQLILEHNNAYRVLTQWRLLTKQTKTIQPLVVRRERKEMAHVFDAWRSIVLRRRQCVNHYEYSQQNKLSGAFSAWKEKAELLQREKEVAQEILDNKLRRCMKGWRGVAQRTVQCQMLTEQIHHSKLQHTFDKWKESWEDLVEKRDDDEAQKAEGHILKSVFLGKWRDTLYDHKDKTDDVLKSFSDYQSGNTMKNAFFNWKKQLLGNQLAREYHDDLQSRLMRQVVQSWNGHAKQTCQDSVEKFKLSLGGPSSPTLSDDSTLSLASQLSETVSQNSSGFHSNIPIASTGSSNNGNHFDGYPGYPIHDEADRWDGPGMFPKPLSFKSNSYPSSLYSDSLHVEIPQNRQLTLKRIILHWKLYPASTAFQQWLSYTRKQKLLCQLQYHMQYTSMLLTLKHGMQVWKRQHAASVKAAEHWETKMKEKCLKAMLYYKIDRKRKQHKTAIATRHSNSGDLMRAFLVWKHRTAERRQIQGIVTNWQDYVSENVRMEGRARKMRQYIAMNTLKECFSVWKLRRQQVNRVTEYHNNAIVKRSFYGWLEVARQRVEQQKKMLAFQEKRCRSMAFRVWQLRLSQKTEVDYRYDVIVENRLKEILQRWHCWAIQNRMWSDISKNLTCVFEVRRLQQCWRVWRQETHKLQQMKIIYETNLASKTLMAWHIEVRRRKENKRKCEEYQQIQMRKTLMKTFTQWWLSHRQNKLACEYRQHTETRMVQSMFIEWRECALITKGQRHYTRSTLCKCFYLWKEHIEEQKRLKYRLKLIVHHWRSQARNCAKMRDIADRYCQEYREIQIANVFRKWVDNTEKSIMSRDYYNEVVKRKCFNGWIHEIQKRIKQRKMMLDFREKSMIRQMASTFDIWKNEYIVSETRTEIVEVHTHKRDNRLLQSVMNEWKQYSRDSKMNRFIRTTTLRKVWSRWTLAMECKRKAEIFAENKLKEKMVATVTFWSQWAKGNKVRRENGEILVNACRRNKLRSVLLYWKTESEKRITATEHYLTKLSQKSIREWSRVVKKEKQMAVIEKVITARKQRSLLQGVLTHWKETYQHSVRMKQVLHLALEKRNQRQLLKSLLQWRKQIQELKADRHRQYLIQRHVVKKWKCFVRHKKEERQNERDMMELAEDHYNKTLCKKITFHWRNEAKMMNFVKCRNQKQTKDCWNVWKSTADKEFTARHIAAHKIYNSVWSRWRKAFIQISVAKAMTSQDNKHLRSEAFNGLRQYTAVRRLGNKVHDQHLKNLMKSTFAHWRERYHNSSLPSSTVTSYSSAPGNLSSSSSETLSVTWN